MSRIEGKRADLGSWTADVLRFTVFHRDAEFQPRGLFALLSGDNPESVTEKTKAKEVVEVGTLDGCSFVVHSQVASQRLDLLLSAPEEAEAAPPVTHLISVIRSAVNRWVTSDKFEVKSAFRLALGVRAVLTVDDVADGYRTIPNYVKIDLGVGSKDFTLQLNRPRPSEENSAVEVNRLVKWSVGRLTRQALAIGPEGLIGMQVPVTTRTGFYAEMDINTTLDPSLTFPFESFIRNLDEFSRLAIEILREGDIP